MKQNKKRKHKQYQSVTEMVQAISDDQEFSEEFDRRISQRQVIKDLLAMRVAHGLKQKDIADRIGCSQSRISKLENGTDNDLRINDLYNYLAAMGFELRLVFAKQGQMPVDAVKYHALCIRRLLDQLAEFAGKDEKIAEGVAGFYGEAFINMVRIVQDSAKKLPTQPDSGKSYIHVEIIESSDQHTADHKIPQGTVNNFAERR